MDLILFYNSLQDVNHYCLHPGRLGSTPELPAGDHREAILGRHCTYTRVWTFPSLTVNSRRQETMESKRPILLKYRYLLTPLFLDVLHIHECTNTYNCSYFGGDGGNLGCGREGTISVCSQFFFTLYSFIYVIKNMQFKIHIHLCMYIYTHI